MLGWNLPHFRKGVQIRELELKEEMMMKKTINIAGQKTLIKKEMGEIEGGWFPGGILWLQKTVEKIIADAAVNQRAIKARPMLMRLNKILRDEGAFKIPRYPHLGH